MTKGIASKNSLKALAYPIQQFLAKWGSQQRPTTATERGVLPAPYELAALRGEGILRGRFFGEFMAKLPVTLDAGQQVALWQELVENGGPIIAWVERLGVAKAIRREATVTQAVNQDARRLYCLLLDAIAKDSPALLPWAVEGYFWHCWKSRFPEATPERANTPKRLHDLVHLKDKLIRQERGKWKEKVEIKESFQTHGDTVVFSILTKRASMAQWQTLITLSRPRLKTARLAAYEAAVASHDIE